MQVSSLLSYWVRIPDLYRSEAVFVDRILRCTRPAELPVEQPTRFELKIDLRTTQAIGVRIPSSHMLRADEVIE